MANWPTMCGRPPALGLAVGRRQLLHRSKRRAVARDAEPHGAEPQDPRAAQGTTQPARLAAPLPLRREREGAGERARAGPRAGAMHPSCIPMRRLRPGHARVAIGEERDRRMKGRNLDRCGSALGTVRGPWRRVSICGGLLLSLAALSCVSSDNASGGQWSCVRTSGDSGAPICACAAKPPSGTPIDNAECRANKSAEWVRCAYSWEDGVCRCNADLAVSADTPGIRIWSCAHADACPSRLVTEGEPCSRPDVMCPGGKTADNIPDPYCICGEAGAFHCSGY